MKLLDRGELRRRASLCDTFSAAEMLAILDAYEAAEDTAGITDLAEKIDELERKLAVRLCEVTHEAEPLFPGGPPLVFRCAREPDHGGNWHLGRQIGGGPALGYWRVRAST